MRKTWGKPVTGQWDSIVVTYPQYPQPQWIADTVFGGHVGKTAGLSLFVRRFGTWLYTFSMQYLPGVGGGFYTLSTQPTTITTTYISKKGKEERGVS